jgi:hypothetical protein
MKSELQITLKKLFTLPLSDRLYVVEHVLRSVRDEYQQELDIAINEVLCKNASLTDLPSIAEKLTFPVLNE